MAKTVADRFAETLAALALGANAVLLGRATLYGLAAAGELYQPHY
jgi:isopentenyl diphosphate isomerase/L-lactate dehydrogenase-like FMN-dependent dehydrogenase